MDRKVGGGNLKKWTGKCRERLMGENKMGGTKLSKLTSKKKNPLPPTPTPLSSSYYTTYIYMHLYKYLGAFSSDDCYQHTWVTTDMLNTIKKGVKNMPYVKKK